MTRRPRTRLALLCALLLVPLAVVPGATAEAPGPVTISVLGNRADLVSGGDSRLWAALREVFPTGVCDYTKPGVDHQGAVPWLTCESVRGGVPMGPAPTSRPLSR